MKKRVLSLLLVLVLIVGAIPFSTISVQAAGLTLSELKAKFPDGKYWNHYVNNTSEASDYLRLTSKNEKFANTITSSPCALHGSASLSYYVGKYDCNYFDGGVQCFGFARKLGYDAYGTRVSTWSTTTSTSSIKPGDVIRYTGGGASGEHSVFVIGVSGSTITVGECNWGSNCIISWGRTINLSSINIVARYIAPWALSSSGTHTHSYTGYYLEAAHPHRAYKQCACGATKLISPTEYGTLSSCASCTMTVDSKYNAVKGFKAYPCVTSNFEVKTSDLSTRGGEIYTTDFCTINELYTNGWCKVTFPMDSGGTRTAYTQISKFIKTPSASLTKYTASSYINLYSTSSLSTQIYRIYPGDVCYTIGTSGSATQIFMPMSSGGYYVLGWVSTSALSGTSSSTEKLSPGLTSLSASSYAKCYTITNGRYNVYTSSSLTTRGYEGTVSSSAWTGESDEIWIIGVGVNSSGTAYAKIKYPVGDSRYIAYVPLHSTLVPGSLTGSYRTAIAKVTGFSDRPGGSTNSSYWVDPGEKVYLLSQQNGYSQILYPISSGVWRIAWCTNSMYNSMFQAQTYTISYNANGGTGAPSAQTKTRDVDLTLSSTKPTRTGYTFVGWATSSSATTAQYSAGSIYTNEATVTLYAVWRKQSFTITYNANGGANAPGAQTQTYATAITVTSQKPEKTYTVTFNANGGTVNTSYYSLDCTFASWNTNSSGTGTTVNAGSSYTPNANVTLYAKYTNPTLGNYPIPSKTGYTFNGWYTASSGGSRVDATTVISANTTLYAQWSLETYSVIYFDDGSSNIPAEQTKTYGTALTLSSVVPVKDGYTFKGWATEEGSNTVVYLPSAQYTNNDWLVLYAVWEKIPATLSSIAIESMPAKTTYQIGEALDISGLKLKLTYSDSTIKSITSGFTTSGFSSATAGTKTVTVSYGGKTASFTVTVEEAVVTGAKYEITDVTGVAGSTVDVYISISNNPGIISLRNTITYDTYALELISVQDCGLLKGYTTPSSSVSSPYTLRWADSLATTNNISNGRLAKITFKIKNGTTVGVYNISVDPVEARNIVGAKVIFSSASAEVTVSKPVHTHTAGNWIIDRNATCTVAGSKHKECTTCGETIETATIPSTGHTSSDWIIDREVTCTTSGSKHRECTTCGEILETNVIISTGHISSGWIIDRNATCTASGSKHKECTICGVTIETSTISATGHTSVKDNAVAATCTTAGKTEGSHCSVCNVVIKAQTTIPAKGHTSSAWIVDKNETCTASGSKHKECTVCGVTTETATIPATGHTVVKDNAIAATCTTAGKTEGSHCSVCNTVIKAQTTIPAKGHTSSAWIVDKNETCTASGSKHKECTVCGVTVQTATIPATGHTVVKDNAIAATCTTAGKTEGSHCSVCNVVIKAQTTVPAKGHTPSAWKVDTETRTRYKECTVCKAVLQRENIPLNAPVITSCYNEVNGVQLKWEAVDGAEKYNVYRKLPSQSNWTYLATTANLAYQDTEVTGNTVYQYAIKAVDQYGLSAYSAQRECRFIETPTLLTRENAVGGVKITWEKVAGATSYRIYRRGAGTDYWFYLGDFDASLNTFTDLETANYFPEDANKNTLAKPKSGNYYRYTVRASYDGEDSNGNPYLIYSGFDTVGLYLKYVATPKLTSISNATNGLQIKWNAVNGGGDIEYRVYRRGAGSTYWYYLGTTTNTTWTDEGVKSANGGYYRYTVRAVAGKNGNGWYSAFDTTGLYLMRLSNPTLNSAVSSSAGITVKWGSVKGATSYYVYRKTASSGWTRIAVVSGNTNTIYIDTTAKKGTTYTYTVRAVYGATTSAYNSGISCYDKY